MARGAGLVAIHFEGQGAHSIEQAIGALRSAPQQQMPVRGAVMMGFADPQPVHAQGLTIRPGAKPFPLFAQVPLSLTGTGAVVFRVFAAVVSMGVHPARACESDEQADVPHCLGDVLEARNTGHQFGTADCWV